MLLKGIVDAAVMGGITNWKHFYADDFADNDKDKEFVRQLREHTKAQVVLIKDGMFVHKRKCPEVQKRFHEYLEEKHEEWLQMIEREYSIKVIERSSSSNTLKRLKSQSVLSLDRISSMYPSNAGQGAVGGSSPNVNSSPSIIISGGKQTNRKESIWVKGDKDKSTPMKGLQTKVNKKFVNKRASTVSTTSSSDSPDSNRNSSENPIELNEQITPRRPPRPDMDRERRNSQQRLSAQFGLPHLPGSGMTNLPITTASFISYTSPENGASDEEDGPPPLPDKLSLDGNTKIGIDAPPLPTRASVAPPRTPRRTRPSVQLENPVDTESAPPLLPEKLTPSRSFDKDRHLDKLSGSRSFDSERL